MRSPIRQASKGPRRLRSSEASRRLRTAVRALPPDSLWAAVSQVWATPNRDEVHIRVGSHRARHRGADLFSSLYKAVTYA
jgi:hypothetical protein